MLFCEISDHGFALQSVQDSQQNSTKTEYSAIVKAIDLFVQPLEHKVAELVIQVQNALVTGSLALHK